MSDLIPSQAFKGSPTGLEIIRQPTFREWDGLGCWLRAADASMAWMIGDWFLLGEGLFGEQASQAFDATDAAESTGWTLKTLEVYAWVCKRIPQARRRPELTFAHHQTVAALDPEQQDRLLEAAASDPDGIWSTRELRRAVRRERGLTQQPGCWVLVSAKDASDAEWLVGKMLTDGRSAKVVERGQSDPMPGESGIEYASRRLKDVAAGRG